MVVPVHARNKLKGGTVPLILNLGIRCRWWSASRLGHFTPGETASGIHLKGGSEGIRASLGLLPAPEFEPRLVGYTARSLVTVPTELITSMYHVSVLCSATDVHSNALSLQPLGL
jgi:hypothetical protein